jgi:hypothetical protein
VKWLIRLYPRAFRQRYERELCDLIDSSPTRLADHPDLIQSIASERICAGRPERSTMRSTLTVWLVAPAILLATASLVSLGYALNDLADGITEAPRHWWSAAPIAGLALAAALGLVVLIQNARSGGSSRAD